MKVSIVSLAIAMVSGFIYAMGVIWIGPLEIEGGWHPLLGKVCVTALLVSIPFIIIGKAKE